MHFIVLLSLLAVMAQAYRMPMPWKSPKMARLHANMDIALSEAVDTSFEAADAHDASFVSESVDASMPATGLVDSVTDSAEEFAGQMSQQDDEEEATSASNSAPRVASRTLYIGNFSRNTDVAAAQRFIQEKIGVENILDCAPINQKFPGGFKGYFYVNLTSSDLNDRAISLLQGVEYDGRTIVASAKQSLNDRYPASSCLFLGRIGNAMDEGALRTKLREYLGDIEIVRLNCGRDKMTGELRGYAYLNFADEATSAKAMEILKGVNLTGTGQVTVSKLSLDNGLKKARTLYMGNLNWGATREHVAEMLDEIMGEGMHEDIRILVDSETGRPRGSAFVTFKTVPILERALRDLEGMVLLGRLLRIERLSTPSRTKITRNDTPRRTFRTFGEQRDSAEQEML